jgi:hypothetical protein
MITAPSRLDNLVPQWEDFRRTGYSGHIPYKIMHREKFTSMNEWTEMIALSLQIQTMASHKSLVDSLK